VFVYTMGLKRRSVQNIVIGGAAGAVPALVGWAAVRGDVGLAAWILFAIVFYWTPPHFWALALRYEKDYAAAGVPMLPVVKGNRGHHPVDAHLLGNHGSGQSDAGAGGEDGLDIPVGGGGRRRLVHVGDVAGAA
jgi:hypothetical protein